MTSAGGRPTTCLAVTLGDPRGIGVEVTRKAVAALGGEASVQFRFIGAGGVSDRLEEACGDTAVSLDDRTAGTIAAHAIEAAVRLALDGEVDAVVTAPIHKPALRMAGYDEPGHTELLQRLTGSARVGMLMAAEHTRLGAPLRVLLATTHVALRDVPDLVTAELLESQTLLLHGALRDQWGIQEPRLALCALNPHASDGGLFGDEEARVFTPAAARLQERGLSVEGPLPADTVFARALAGAFDAVVAPYHDVGMAAFKTVSFGAGVNVTLGLPFPRTSPDHGTAFDLVGQDRADPTSMLEALRLAARLARRGRSA